MKKIAYFLALLSMLIYPLTTQAFTRENISAEHQFVSRADLNSQSTIRIPVNFILRAPNNELAEVKLIKISVEDTCQGQSGSHLQAGDLRPQTGDSNDGEIRGTLYYVATKNESCNGDHDITFYFCKTTNINCYSRADELIGGDGVTLDNIVTIGDTPPPSPSLSGSAPPPTQSPQEETELLPGRLGRFGTIWDLLAGIVQLLLALAAIVAVGAIIVGGYQYMTSQGIPDKSQVAKSTITYAIIGLIIVVLVYTALRFVLPTIGVSRDVIWF